MPRRGSEGRGSGGYGVVPPVHGGAGETVLLRARGASERSAVVTRDKRLTCRADRQPIGRRRDRDHLEHGGSVRGRVTDGVVVGVYYRAHAVPVLYPQLSGGQQERCRISRGDRFGAR